MKKRLYPYFWMGCLLLAACSDAEVEIPGGGQDNPEPSPSLTGYADPAGVLILSGGTYTVENAFLTFIRPDGEVEDRVYAAANGTELGNDGVGLYMDGSRQYILCNDWRTADGKGNNGLLTVADAESLEKEKSFSREEMVFRHPLDEKWEEVDENLNGIAVLDEQNVFIFAQGVLRFNSLTGELKLVEGAYDIGNRGSANTVESIASPRGAVVVDDCLYAAAGGFWSATALLEFAKGKDEVNRRLELGKGDLVSGMCLTDDGTLVVGTYTRGRDIGYFYFVDLENWSVADVKTVSANISPASHLNSGIVYLNGYIYFTGAEETEFTAASHTTLCRYSLATGRVEKDIVDFKQDEPDANLLDCNVVADFKSGCLYVATSKERWEGVIPESSILVYDCGGDVPQLVRKIRNVGHSVKGIYPMSMFASQF